MTEEIEDTPEFVEEVDVTDAPPPVIVQSQPPEEDTDAAPGPANARQVYWLEADPEGHIVRAGVTQPQTAHMYEPIDENGTLHWFLEDPGVWLDRDSYFVEDGQPVLRSALPVAVSKNDIAADDIDEVVISGIPLNAIVKIDGETLEGVDGELFITSPMPATYFVEIECWPWLDFKTEVVAA